MQISQITSHTAFQHIARIGHAGRVLRNGFQTFLRNAPSGTKLDMQTNLDIQYRLKPAPGLTHARQAVGLVDRQCISTGELDQEQIILLQIMPEFCRRQIATGDTPDKVMSDIGVPVTTTGTLQAIKGSNGHVTSAPPHRFQLPGPS